MEKILEAIFEKHLQMVYNHYKGKEFQSNIKLLMGVRQIIVADILVNAGNFLFKILPNSNHRYGQPTRSRPLHPLKKTVFFPMGGDLTKHGLSKGHLFPFQAIQRSS